MARLAGFAADESQLSNQEFKHGAIICKGGKKICGGHNINTRTAYRGNICCSFHAEMGTVTKFLNSYIKIHSIHNSNKIKRKMNKYSICVVRCLLNKHGHIMCQNSFPCSDCIKKLQTVGLKNIMYSTQHGTIITAKISTFSCNHVQFITSSMKKPVFIENMRFKSLI